MGIFGLQGLLIENKPIFSTKEKLCQTKLVIDCNNLQHFLLDRAFLSAKSFNYRVDKYGCNFKEYARITLDFFKNLLHCGINPTLVVDGSASGKGHFTGLNEARELLLQKQGQERIATDQMESEDPIIKRGRLLIPRLYKAVFRQVTTSLDIETIQVAYEANHVIVKLANELDCPVLANDSDFIIYPINRGFIVLKAFYWKRNPEGNFLECDVFKRELFVGAFQGLKPECLPFLNVLLGKHTQEIGIFDHIAKSIDEKGDAGVEIKTRTYLHNSIAGLLVWLRGKTREETVASILDKIDEDKRKEAEEFCLKSLNVYNIDEVGDIGDELEKIYPPNHQLHELESPTTYLLKLFALYDLSGPCLNIILGKPDHDMSFLSDYSKPSPFMLEFRAFSVAMALLRPKSIDKMKEDGSYEEEKQVFNVYTREGQSKSEPKYGKFDIKPMEHLDVFGTLNHLDSYSMIGLSKDKKKQLLMDTFRYDEAQYNQVHLLLSKLFKGTHVNRKESIDWQICQEATICMMLIKYMAIETKTPIDEMFLTSVLLMFFRWVSKQWIVSFELMASEDRTRLCNKIRPHTMSGSTIQYPNERELYKKFVQQNLSLQAAYRAHIMLNNLLDIGSELNPRPDLWFDGRLMFRLMAVLETDGVDKFIDCVELQTLFNQILAELQVGSRDIV